jgi:hypothetical protein
VAGPVLDSFSERLPDWAVELSICALPAGCLAKTQPGV